MASIGHVAVGMVAARREGGGVRRMVLWSALSLLPDADVVAFWLRIPYGAPFGHRGASHSLVAALVVAGVIAAFTPRARRASTGLLAFAVVASHGLLDALTDGGRGVALLWPFSTERFFAPFRPLPVAPIGARLLSPRGLYVMMVETVVFAPLIVFALWPKRKGRAF